ncbi:MAG: response regulator [Bdellovibrionales bacterium]|nr:response regulator [Bdellovibrionales bacterium]
MASSGQDEKARLHLQALSDAAELQARLEDESSRRVSAERRLEAMELFLAQVVHELRTPLNGVLANLELICLESEELAANPSVASANLCAATLRRQIDDLLDLSRIRAARMELRSDPVAIRDVLAAAVGIVRPEAAARGIAIREIASFDQADRYMLDAHRLAQVFVNLLHNAVTFSPVNGDVTITVRITESASPFTLECLVSDQGQGIPLALATRLFRAFSQLDSEALRSHGGSGLGLSICHELVTLMGGTITLFTAEGSGTTFRVRLPLKRASSAEVPASGKESTLSELSETVPRRVLVVDDNWTNRAVLLRLLAKIGYEAQAAASGMEALAMLRETHFDIVVLDLQMPDVDGWETLSRIRALDAAIPQPRVIVCSAQTMERETALHAAEVDGFLCKPISVRELRSVLDGAARACSC